MSSSYKECIIKGFPIFGMHRYEVAERIKRYYISRNDMVKANIQVKKIGFKNKQGTTDVNYSPK